MAESPTLLVKQLTVAYRINDHLLDAVRDVSLTIYPGQVYGLVGESGSGKTTLAMAILRYLGNTGVIRQGRIELCGKDLLALDLDEMRKIWGRQMTFVPQNPLSSLNPSIQVGEQIAEILRLHLAMDQPAARRHTLELLRLVRLPDPQRVADSYPHQISGGMQQRVLIAMALSTEPALLLLDEPTTSLDVTTQAAILDLIRDLIRGRQTSVLYVTHNLGVVAQLCDRVAVLYAGELVEDAPLAELFRQPLHPYTLGLLGSVPRLGATRDRQELQSIPGQIPPLGARPLGCVFMPRCSFAVEACQERPELSTSGTDRQVRCFRWQELSSGLGQITPSESAAQVHSSDSQEPASAQPVSAVEKTTQPVLSIDNLRVYFPLGRSLGEIWRREPLRQVKAVDGVSLELAPGKTVGLVGESGSGKSTLGRSVVGLAERTDGGVELFQLPLPARLADREFASLRRMQMVFQNPEEALNPYRTIGATLRQPLLHLVGLPAEDIPSRIYQLLQAVRLPADYASRMPGQLSGGEKQRIAIARAFASNPDLLITDEAVSALDVSVQASILNLLNELQNQFGTTLLFISHDLAVVTYLADIVAVIYLGQLMQVSPTRELLNPPYHPYTEALFSSVPIPDPQFRQVPAHLAGDIPSPIHKPAGCPFHTRCPRSLGDLCITQPPPWQETTSGSRLYCHIPLDQLQASQTPIVKD